MANNQAGKSTPGQKMRPHIEITHAQNGRVKDWAAEHDFKTSEAYSRIIEAGLEALVSDVEIDWDEFQETYDLSDDEIEAERAIVRALASETYPVTKTDLVNDLHEEYPAGKGDGDWWWRQLVTETLVDAGVVEKIANPSRVRLSS